MRHTTRPATNSEDSRGPLLPLYYIRLGSIQIAIKVACMWFGVSCTSFPMPGNLNLYFTLKHHICILPNLLFPQFFHHTSILSCPPEPHIVQLLCCYGCAGVLGCFSEYLNNSSIFCLFVFFCCLHAPKQTFPTLEAPRLHPCTSHTASIGCISYSRMFSLTFR